MKAPRFTIFQLMLFMLLCSVLSAACYYAVSGVHEVSPFIFLLMLLASPVALVVIVSLFAEFRKRRR